MRTESINLVVGRRVVFSLVALLLLLFTLGAARGATLVQEFYLPMPEAQIYQANSAIIAGAGQTNFSTFSIVVTGDGTQVYYDHWEDGYEVNLAAPSQSTTLVWGDGNNANGICPGFTNDPVGLPAGTIITLTNNVGLPRNPAQILWDARDRVAATKALVISRAAWPIPTGPVFAGAVGVLSTLDYGTNYISPVGQDLTNNLFKYVGMFVMAAQNNTSVTIDTNGTGLGTFTVVLNQGESYLINGGIKKGGRITASKPVQADLLIGRVGASFASDWFTLYPVESWDDTYYTPVSSASSGTQPAYVYLFNPSTNAITINFNTQAGGGSFAIPGTNGVYQFQMPIGSGASFTSAGGQNFFAVCTVAANNNADTAYNWGFTLVPKAALTTEATVGWGPGSADGTVNGSPVWVTALAGTTLYVDYKGDKAGPLTDPNGSKYDTNFTVVNLQSLRIYDPSRNQTGMRVYTVDGTLLTAAWGEDADRAQPGNPYIDAGTTVLPFPTPVILKTAFVTNDVAPTGLSVGDTVQYNVQVDNKGLLPLGNTVVIDAPSTNLIYVSGSTKLNGVNIPDSVSGTPFPLDGTGYTIPLILSRGTSLFAYQFQVASSGNVSNSVNIGGTTISANATIPPTPTNGATVNVRFTDNTGATVLLYSAGGNVFVTLTNAVGNTSSNTIQTLFVTVTDTNSADAETILLTETSTNSGVFRNVTGLPTSLTTGLVSQDGTLKVSYGDILRVSYTEPLFGSSSSATAAIQVPAQTKQLYLSVNGSTNGVQALNRLNPVALGNATTRTSADIGIINTGSNATVTLLSTTLTTNNSSAVTTITNVSVGAISNGMLLVGVTFNPNGAGSAVTNVTFGSQTLTQVSVQANGNFVNASVWALANPPAITTNVVIRYNGAQNGMIAGALVLSGVNQTAPFTATNTANSSGGSPSVTVTSQTGDLVFNIAGQRSSSALNTNSANQTKLWGLANDPAGGASTQPGAAPSVTTTWTSTTSGSPQWASISVSIRPANLGGGVSGTNVTTFTQTPVFAAPFIVASNNLVTITNYITLTNGSFGANPDVTARLQFNGTNFLTLTNPVYSATSNTLVWSTLLASNVATPSGAAITLQLSNGVPNTSFRVDYDSTNKPSKITLPTTTVIGISTLGVYDAPFPGGTLVTTPVAGSTLYVRAVVTDPFGSYDITSLGLGFTAPNTNNNFSVTLNNSSVVASNALSKTYEYVWNTGPATGNYAIAATASEGSEGVTASASTGISTIFLDLGTPSTTEFTSGNNGPATNSYLANSSVCFRVTDLNRNTNAATLQSIIATLTSSSGDSEIVTLTEISTNSGIFTACFTTSTNAPVIPNNSILTAPVGSVLTISYTDPDDASDSTSATATIQPLPGVPGILMNKTVVSPSGAQVGVNQPVVYNLQVINTGSTTLTNVAIVDTFSANRLTFAGASVTPNVIAAPTLTWTNLGNFAPGQSTNITVNFTTTATGTATNLARASSTAATNSSVVSLAVNSAALNVVKILLPPTNQPVAVGSNVTFRITIQNVGNTTINNLPFQDTYSGAYYQYVSATIPTNSAAFGLLNWTNLAATPLLTNAIITNDITMRVIGQGNPANNTAIAEFATDIFGNPVPVASSTVGLITASAGVSGFVINDTNQSGTLDSGETGLANVTIQLFTDPNGDGNPADGSLVQQVTTIGTGYYELLNLNVGRYVVVETDPLGYSSSAPANNRLALNITNLVTYTNNNFFDFIPAPSVYSTFTGRVINDTNGFGTNLLQAGLPLVTVDLIQDVNSNGIVDLGEPVLNSATTGTNGSYSIGNISPGWYVLRETDPLGYYSTGDSQPPNNNQISFVTTNGITVTNRNFFDRLLPVANADTNTVLLLVATTLSPLTNDVSPNGDPLIITNAIATGGTVSINPGSTNLNFTATNLGTATIIYTITDRFGGTNSAVITITVNELADLAIGKTAAGSVLATGNLTYTLSVTNLGPTPASSVTVTDTLPATVSFVSASGNGVNNSGIVTWNLGTLAANAVSNLTVTVTAPAAGTLTNFASIGSPTPDPTPTNNTTPPVVTTVTPQADLSVTKSGVANVNAAENLTYTISVTNSGPSTASGVIVTDTLPGSVTFVTASGNGTTNGNLVTWNLGSVASGATSNLTVTVTAPASGSLTNIASIGSPTGDPVPTNNTTPPVVTVVTPLADLAVGKTGAAAGVLNANFTYTISVTNLGPSSAANFAVTDSLPAGIVFVSSVPLVTTNGSNQVIWTNLGVLALNATTNLSLTVKAVARGSVTNLATVGGPTSDPNPTNNTSPPVATSITNRPPVAVNDNGSTPKNIGVSIAALANDSDADGDLLTLISVSPTNGTANIVGTNVVFLPATNFLGTATVGYGITDGFGGTNFALITITITNFPPLANPDNYAMQQNTTNSFPVLVNDTLRTPGGTLSLISVTPTNGTATISGTNIVFTPTLNFLGTATIGYTITDSIGGTNSAVVTITVTNLPPLANPDGYAVFQNSTNTFGPLTNDVLRTPGGTLSIVSVTPTNGTASISGTNIIFTPTPGFTGTATIGYTITDGIGGTNSTLITVNVQGLADIFVSKSGPANVYAATNFDYTITVTNFGPGTATSLSVTDALPASVTFVSATPGAVLNGSQLIWTNLGSLAANSATNLTVTVTAPLTSVILTNLASGGSPTSDPNLTNNTSPPVLTSVTPIANVAIGKTAAANVNAAANLIYSLSVTNFGPSSASSLIITDTLPANATFVSASGNGSNTLGVVTWNLGLLASNQITNLTVTVTAPASGSLTNTASLGSPILDPVPSNNVTPPVITAVVPQAEISVTKTGPIGALFGTNYSYALAVSNAGPSTAANLVVTDSLPAGLVFVSAVPAATTNSSNQVIWNLGNFAAGSASNLTLTVNSTLRGALTNIASVGSPTSDPVPSNNVTPPVVTLVTNFPPLANPDSASITENTSTSISALINDSVRTPGGSLTILSVTPTNGIATIVGTNVTFTPSLNFIGVATIGYVITDNVGGTNSSVITITVTNIPPLANVDNYAMPQNTTNTFSPLVNDSVQTPGGALAIVSLAATNGTASISGTNVVFTPTLNFLGTATIGYVITDGIGGTNTSLITITVTNVPPLANPDSYFVAENSTNTFAVLINDIVRTPGGILSLVSVSPTNGTASISGTNVTFTPTLNFVGVTFIGYTITDGLGGTNSSLITVTVTNQAPTAFPQSLATTMNIALPITLTGSDPVNRPLTFSIVSSPVGGTLTGFNTNSGAVTYTPTNNFAGTDSFVFRVNNGVNNSSNAVITIAVTPTADLLVQQSGPANGVAGANLIFTVAVTNLGPATATNVVVTNRIDAGYNIVSASAGGATNGNLVTWTIPILPANGRTNLTVTLLALEGGTFTNLASGINATLDLNVTNNNGSLTNAQVVTTVSASANLAITKSAAANVNAAANLTYNLVVTNSGPSTASGVIVTDTLPASVTFVSASGNGTTNGNLVTWNLGTLASGAASNLTVTVTAPASGSITNIATIGSPTPDPTPTNNTTPPVVTLVTPLADLAIGKSGATGSALGANFIYTISVTNLGPSIAANFAVTDALPVGIVFVSAVPPTTTNASSQVIWTNLGSLAVNATTNLSLTVRAVARGGVTNFATVGGPTIDPNPTNNISPPVTTSVTNRLPVAVDDSRSTPKNVSVTIAALVNDSDPDGDALTIVSVSPTNGVANIVGTNVTFLPATNFIGIATIGYTIIDGFGGTNSALITITVTNRAPVANSQSAATSFNTGTNLTLTGSDPDNDPLTYSLVGLPVGGVLTGFDSNTGAVTYTPTNNFVGADTFTFRVNDGTTNSALATVTINVGTPVIADLAVFKTGPTNATAGSNVVYSITVTNLGTGIATNVIVRDLLPANFQFISATPTNSSFASNVVTWSVFRLAPNTRTNFTVTLRPLEGGTFTNVAVATSDAYDTNPTNNSGVLTNSHVRTVVAPLADVLIFKDGGTNVAAGSIVNYIITATNAGPSTAQNVVLKDNLPAGATFSSADGSYTVSNNVVTWAALTLTNGESQQFSIALIAPASGAFTNIAFAVSSTPDPNSTNNNGSFNRSRVATRVSPVADLVVLLTGPTNAVQGSNFVYSLILSNAGPSTASNAVASNVLPGAFNFVSATGGGVASNGIITWPRVAALPVGSKTNYFFTVNSPFLGTFTNIASAVSTTFDPNPTNNTGVLPEAKVLTTISTAGFDWLAGTPVFNPQTGLYEQTVIVTNTGNGTVAGFELYVNVLTPNVRLWNATGTNGGVPFLLYRFPVDPTNTATMILEFYNPLRVNFTNTLRVVPVIPANIGVTSTNGSVDVSRVFVSTNMGPTRFVIEFASEPNRVYTIIYSADMQTWKVATPSIRAAANVTQWYDDGPPKTESAPTSVSSRFYRVIKN